MLGTIKKKRVLFILLLMLGMVICSSIGTQAALPDGTPVQSVGKKYTGWVKNKKNLQYFKNGKKTKNKIISVQGKYYYLNKSGNLKTGWVSYKNKKYYFSKKDGYAYTGISSVGKDRYCFDAKGRLRTKKGKFVLNGKMYIVKSSKGNLSEKPFAIGKSKCNGKWYYIQKPDGTILRNNHVIIKGVCYKARSTGEISVVKNSYVFIDGNCYMAGEEGELSDVKDSQVTYNSKEMYVDSKGKVIRNRWFEEYYYDANGYKMTSPGFNNKALYLSKEVLDRIGASKCKNLMIVAHPDDESLFGGTEIIKGGYLVITLTNGDNPVRKAEFERAMKASGNVGYMLSYPDINEQRVKSTWTNCKQNMAADVDVLLNYKHWDKVVTHNKWGDYGHPHHKMAHVIVEAEYNRLRHDDSLYCFMYYKKNVVESRPDLVRQTDEEKEKIQKLFEYYPSQQYSIDLYKHMAGYQEIKPNSKF